jgi:tRNA 2-thiocytidine biosynthesis protein TtcA
MKPLEVQISKEVGRAIIEYGMIEEGDRVAVAVSGGKDSLTLLDILMKIRRRAPVRFDLIAVTVDQGYEGFRWPVMERHFRELGVPFHIENTRISDLIDEHKAPGATQCSLCARLRRGVLYGLAKEKGWTKIALGHHADDLIETLLLSQLYNGTIQSMPPILRADDGCNVVIRPLAYVWEDQIAAYTKERAFPVICCACTACTDLTLKRKQVKALLAELEAGQPGIKRSLLRAQSRAKVTQLMDPRFLPLGEKASLREKAASIVEGEPPEEEARSCEHPRGANEGAAATSLVAIQSRATVGGG